MYYLSSVRISTKSPTSSSSSLPTSVDECSQGPSARAKDESTPSLWTPSMKYIRPSYPTPLRLRTSTKFWTWSTLQGFALDPQDVEALYCLLPHLTIVQLLDDNLIVPARNPRPYNPPVHILPLLDSNSSRSGSSSSEDSIANLIDQSHSDPTPSHSPSASDVFINLPLRNLSPSEAQPQNTILFPGTGLSELSQVLEPSPSGPDLTSAKLIQCLTLLERLQCKPSITSHDLKSK
jgi:hypothetical protein